jgi:predicted acylesterase/phospholipase RssA
MKKLMVLMLALAAGQACAQNAASPTVPAPSAAVSQNPCTNGERRALIFSGGAIKGSFEAGAAWYLVVVRKCDFHDFAGVSVGGFNAALLAQACRTDDAVKSYTCLEAQTEALVGLWQSFKSSRDILHHKFLGGIAFAVFGAEALNDTRPLRRALTTHISFQRISKEGRPLRFGVTSMWDGGYREIAISGPTANINETQFMDFLVAGGSPPVIVKMPRNCEPESVLGDCVVHQHGDGGMRSGVPVASYFPNGPLTAHGSLQQLWVLGTSVYEPGSSMLPVPSAANQQSAGGAAPSQQQSDRSEKQIFGKGTQIANRAVSVLIDTAYRRDLEFLFRANSTLRWRAQVQERVRAHSGDLAILNALAQEEDEEKVGTLESFNADGNGGFSRPYTIGLVTPERETVDLSALTNFNSEMVRQQLLDGCLAADRLMNAKFHLESMKEKCMERFSEKPGGARKSAG